VAEHVGDAYRIEFDDTERTPVAEAIRAGIAPSVRSFLAVGHDH
jgi:hypothetical protein